MSSLFDTSVVVAALHQAHPAHRSALNILKAAAAGSGAYVTSHALAEIWSVLTRLPEGHALAPAEATRAVERVAAQLQVIVLHEQDYWNAMQRCQERGLRSGAIFDALHLMAAERLGIKDVLTFNARDFHRISKGEGLVVTVPQDDQRKS